MRKTSILVMMLLMTLCRTPSVLADTPIDKLGRGITNIITGPGELFLHLAKQQENHRPAMGIINGLLYGTFFTVVREIAGVYEVGTFILPLPWKYRPVMKPATLT